MIRGSSGYISAMSAAGQTLRRSHFAHSVKGGSVDLLVDSAPPSCLCDSFAIRCSCICEGQLCFDWKGAQADNGKQ